MLEYQGWKLLDEEISDEGVGEGDDEALLHVHGDVRPESIVPI